MRLKTKILMGYGAVLALTILVCSWGVINLRRLGRSSEAILQENYQSIRYAESMIDAIGYQDNAILLFLLKDREQGRKQFLDSQVQFLLSFERAEGNITIPQEREILNTLERRYQDYIATAEQVQQSSDPQTELSIDDYYETLQPSLKLVRESSIALREINKEAMQIASQNTQRISQQAIWSTILAGGTAAGLGLGFSFILANRLVRPLRKMTRATEQISEGNYDIEIDSLSNDELGVLAREITTMSQKLKAFQALNVEKVIAEKQRSEAIILSISDGLIVVDSEFKIIAINQAAARLVKTPEKIAAGNHFLDIFNHQTLYEYIKRTAQTGKSPEIDEKESVISVEKGKNTLYYKISITPVTVNSDKVLGVVLLLQDITKLKELDRLKSEFVATASHELRTPLTGMAMSINLLLETTQEKLSDREIELLQAAEEDVERLRGLVNDLLDLSKIESGRLEMEFSEVEADFLLEKAVSALQIQAEEKQIELLQHVPENLPQVRADPNKIVWVLTNLIANALRYTEVGGEIQVSAYKKGTWIQFSVEDDGEGIPWEYQSKIFDKFVQVKTEKDVGGSGLGLAICKEMVQAHGGKIWVDSTPGEGSTFAFSVPVVSDRGSSN
ncbi:ATP-binding protein [Lusitaniella coriacea]|uniref:HAMP domain-containing sensor histidine kinase n=1 Tax=Lusitaniella coriacea TaxID=1983105 RepID=UPI003CE70F04